MFRLPEEQVELFRRIYGLQLMFSPKLSVHLEEEHQPLLIPEDPLPTVMISEGFEVTQVIADHSSGSVLGADESDRWDGSQAFHMPGALTDHWDGDTLIACKAPDGTIAIVKVMLKVTLDSTGVKMTPDGKDLVENKPLAPGTVGITFEDHLIAQAA